MTNVEQSNGHSSTTMERRRGRVRVPEGERREDKFVRLALHRMTALKVKARQVKNLANYPHTEAQAAKIVGELKTLAAEIETAFVPRSDDQFSF